MIMKGIFTYDSWGMLQRFVGKLVESRFHQPIFKKLVAILDFQRVPVPPIPPPFLTTAAAPS